MPNQAPTPRAMTPGDYPIHRIQEARDRWYQVREGLQKLESCLEGRIPVPPWGTFGGMMGCEWEPRLAELPDRLSRNIIDRVIPAIEACCQHPDTSAVMRQAGKSAIDQLYNAMLRSGKVKPKVAKASTPRPRRATQLAAIRTAQSLIVDALFPLDDLLRVAEAQS